jgi:hypothetical protein
MVSAVVKHVRVQLGASRMDQEVRHALSCFPLHSALELSLFARASSLLLQSE